MPNTYMRLTTTYTVKVPRSSVDDFVTVLERFAREEELEKYSFEVTGHRRFTVTGTLHLVGPQRNVTRTARRLRELLDGR